MATVDQQVLELAQQGFAPGERALATMRVSYNGTTNPNTFTIDSGLAALGGPAESEPDPDKLITFPAANQMVLLLTDRRVLVWSTGMRGKPKSFVGDVPLRGITALRAGAGRRAAQVELVMKSGASVALEVARGEDAAGFLTEATPLVGTESF